jgi:hypothetical protein
LKDQLPEILVERDEHARDCASEYRTTTGSLAPASNSLIQDMSIPAARAARTAS